MKVSSFLASREYVYNLVKEKVSRTDKTELFHIVGLYAFCITTLQNEQKIKKGGILKNEEIFNSALSNCCYVHLQL